MKILLLLLALIPMVGIAQSGMISDQPTESHTIEWEGIDQWKKGLQLLEGQLLLKPVASAFLNTTDEHKAFIDSSCIFRFPSAIDSSLTSRTIYKYDTHGNLILLSFNYLSENRYAESYRTEYTFDENGNLVYTLHFILNYRTNQWIKRNRFEYTYDLNGRVIKTITYSWKEDGTQLKTSKIEKKYDEHGNILLETSSQYNTLIDQWVDNLRKEYAYKNDKCTLQINSSQMSDEPIPLVFMAKSEWEYDANGNLLSNVISTWNESSNKWMNSGKDTYTYNSNSKVTNHTNLFWESNHWQDSQKTDYSYDAKDHKILEVISQWDSYNWVPGQWIPYRQTEYTPDINGNEEVTVVKNWDRMNNKWKTTSKYEKIYNDQNLLHSKLSYLWNPIDNLWHPVVKEDYRYNSDGNTTIYARYYWKEDSKEWWISDKNYQYYSVHDLTNGLDQLQSLKVKLFPNPAHEVFTLNINDLALSYCQLFDANGQLIQTMPVEQGINTYNISHLRPGMYLLKMKAEGETIVKKIIKN